MLALQPVVLEPEAGIEPATCSLRVSCSTPELPGRAKRSGWKTNPSRYEGLVEHIGHSGPRYAHFRADSLY
jgi:hypothetical protein